MYKICGSKEWSNGENEQNQKKKKSVRKKSLEMTGNMRYMRISSLCEYLQSYNTICVRELAFLLKSITYHFVVFLTILLFA